jgi:hypothetical protein
MAGAFGVFVDACREHVAVKPRFLLCSARLQAGICNQFKKCSPEGYPKHFPGVKLYLIVRAHPTFAAINFSYKSSVS